ncbi:hypothetical protein ZWY2020_012419 [Hordeum vulgare]|nr:hypothetical protein ZWY2020_012419 [Hordeum vulgare]
MMEAKVSSLEGHARSDDLWEFIGMGETWTTKERQPRLGGSGEMATIVGKDIDMGRGCGVARAKGPPTAKRMISQRTHMTMFTRTSSSSKLFNCDDLQQHQRLGSTPEQGLIGHVKLEYDVPPFVDHKLAM